MEKGVPMDAFLLMLRTSKPIVHMEMGMNLRLIDHVNMGMNLLSFAAAKESTRENSQDA